jgi:hypothetical protein
MSEEPREGGDAKADLVEAVTLVTRAVGSALDRVGDAVGHALSGLVGGGGGGAPASQVLPEIRPLFPVEPGDEASTRVRLVNNEDGASEPFDLTVTDLVSQSGDRIPADAVSLAQHQRVVAANGSDTVLLTIAVPPDAKPGSYRGELQPSEASVLPAAVAIEVR